MDGFIRRPQISSRPTQTTNYNPETLPDQEYAEQPFYTPEQAAANDHVSAKPDDQIELDNSSSGDKPPKQRRSFKAWFRGLTRGKRWLLIISVILICAGAGAVGYILTRPAATTKPAAVADRPLPEEPPQPVTEPNTLTGREVDPSVNKIPVTAVMIENSRDARPQSGLQEAGVVFEAIAEGGITRFLALYQDTAPESIGPIRSVRPYYVDWAKAFNPSIAHVGGSAEALQLIKTIGMQDIDQGANSGSYTRITERYAPHNVYTSFARLQQLQSAKGFTSSKFTGFARKASAPAAEPTATKITVNVSSSFYGSSYTYDKGTNTYLRSMGGEPHKDADSGKQIAPSSVVIMTIPYSIQSNGIHSQYQTIGSGEVHIFQDGGVIKGTWHKTSRDSQITFTDANGNPIQLVPGQTWLTAIAQTSRLTYQ